MERWFTNEVIVPDSWAPGDEPEAPFIVQDEVSEGEEISLLDLFCLLIRIADALGLSADEEL